MIWLSHHLLFTSMVLFLVAVGVAFLVFHYQDRIHPHQAARQPLAGALVSVSVSLLFSVFLNHLFAISRARDDRERAVRDRHFEQIRPVLKHEADQMKALAQEIRLNAGLDAIDVDRAARRSALKAHLWPDLMSEDIRKHFAEYDAAKRKIEKEIEALDSSAASIVSRLEPNVAISEPYGKWKRTIAISKAASCSGHGDGVVLNTTNDGRGFTFSYFRGTVGGGGPPSPEYSEVARSYAQVQLDPSSGLNCDDVKQRSGAIAAALDELANTAGLLVNHAALPGTCEFLDKD